MNQISIPKIWNQHTYKIFSEELNKLVDPDYLKFNKKIITSKYNMLGIRVPVLRKISSKIKKTSFEDFLKVSVPETHEEIFIRGIVISYIKDYELFLNYFTDFLDYIDNWAICDTVLSSLKIIKKNKAEFKNVIEKLLNSEKEYYVRVGVVALMYYYIEPNNLQELFSYLNNIKHSAYYVHMAIAWMVSIMYIKYPHATEAFLSENTLNKETHNKAIQKIRESKQVSKKTKDYLLKYKK